MKRGKLVKLFRVVAECENDHATCPWFYRYAGYTDAQIRSHTPTTLAGGMGIFDLPGVTAPDYNGKVGRFWYTARGWKAAKVAKFLAAEGKGVTYTVKVIAVPKSAIIWTDGTQAIVRKS